MHLEGPAMLKYVVKSSKMVYCCNFMIELLLDSGSRTL